MEPRYHSTFGCWRICDATGRPTLPESEIQFQTKEECLEFLNQRNSGRWYIMRGTEIIFGAAKRATLADCQAELERYMK